MGVAAEAYARQLKQLLPRGPVWRLELEAKLQELMLAIGEELARIDGRSDTLVEEWDPRTAVETLADWERVLALPEFGNELPATIADRQVLSATKLAARGGQTAAYFVALATTAGFPGTWIDEPTVHTWRMHVDLDLTGVAYDLVDEVFRTGSSRTGDRLASVTVPQLEVVIRRYAPAHTVLWFLYT